MKSPKTRVFVLLAKYPGRSVLAAFFLLLLVHHASECWPVSKAKIVGRYQYSGHGLDIVELKPDGRYSQQVEQKTLEGRWRFDPEWDILDITRVLVSYEGAEKGETCWLVRSRFGHVQGLGISNKDLEMWRKSQS